MPSGKKTGQNVAVFQIGRTMTPRADEEEMIFFHDAINLPMGGQTKRHSLDQSTEKASVANEPGKAKREKNRSQRALEGEAKGSRVKPSGRKRDCSTEKEALSMPQSSLSKERDPTSAA